MIESFAKLVSPELLQRSGKVFYSGRLSFSQPSDLYLMGYNPGADNSGTNKANIKLEIEKTLNNDPANYSAYEESWDNNPPGTTRMQPRVLHMLRQLGHTAGGTPSSNLIFVRSKDEMSFNNEAKRLEELCWPFHAAVIRELKVRVVVCFGHKAANAIKKRLAANRTVGTFVEQNKRGWTSEAFANKEGFIVVDVTHPSRAGWTNPDADPSPLVREMLARSKVR